MLAVLGAGVLAVSASADHDGYGDGPHQYGPRTYLVTNLAASGHGSLADAIAAADAHHYWQHGGRDRIVFAVAGEIEPGVLPPIAGPVDIDATTAPGYELGAPVIEIRGDGTGAGLDVTPWATGTRITGLAIGGFEKGVVVAADHTSICANFIGTDLGGDSADPNGVGIEALSDYDLIGSGNCCDEGNVVSGNRGDGIVVLGSHDHLAGNLIGTDAAGTGPLPNGGAGVRIGPGASANLIGGAGEEGPGNTIAYNGGAGVLVEPGATETTISSNSIFANGGLGIEVPAGGGGAPDSPVLTGFDTSTGGTTVRGTFAGEPASEYVLELFASEACVPSGQGRSLLGSFTVTTDAEGKATFEAAGLAALPAGAKFISATATGGASHSTSEFSACLGEPHPEPTVAARIATPEPAAAAPAEIVPVNGRTITIEPKGGKVLVKAPGELRFRPVSELEAIAIGSAVDTTEGKARIASANVEEVPQSAAFLGGVFRVLQPRGKTLTTMRLLDGEFEPCAAAGAERATASAAGRGGNNHLWGSGKGNFRTEGNNGSATVRGTIWYVADRCEGTFFKVNRGVVAVRDFTLGRTITLRAGGTYTAG
jgi:parallel beta-helix repeat protein